MRTRPLFLALATALVTLTTAACEEDPARLREGPRHVWVAESTILIPGDTLLWIVTRTVTRGGCAFAVAPPERAGAADNALLFVDATLRDPLGYAGSAELSLVTPGGDTIRGDGAGCPGLEVALTEEEVARRGEREALELGTTTWAGYAACARLESLEAWTAARVRNDARATGSLTAGQSCVVVRAGLPVSRGDTTSAGNVRVRVYAEDEAVRVWIPAQAISEGR